MVCVNQLKKEDKPMKCINVNIKEDTLVTFITEHLGKNKVHPMQLQVCVQTKPDRDDYSMSIVDGCCIRGLRRSIVMLWDRFIIDD